MDQSKTLFKILFSMQIISTDTFLKRNISYAMLFIVRNHDFLCFQNLCHIFRDEMCVTSVNQILEKKNFLRSIFLGFSFSSVMKYRCWITNIMFLHIKHLDFLFQFSGGHHFGIFQ